MPPNTNIIQKHVLLISNNSGPIGICDFIEGYPDETILKNIWKPDFLHMNYKGYEIWLKKILPYL